MAFVVPLCPSSSASASSWTPSFSSTAAPPYPCAASCPATQRRHLNMVLDKSIPTNSQAQLPEACHSIHSRLGIASLWDNDTLPRPDFAPPQSSEHSLDATSSDDVLLTTDPSSVAPKPWDTTTGIQTVSFLGHRMHSLHQRRTQLNRSYEECRRITELFSKTFYMGTSLLSPEKRRAVWAIYTWCRRTDDLVDGPRVTQRSAHLRETLAHWEKRLTAIFHGRAHDTLDLALVDAISNFPDLLAEPFQDMIKGMQMDVEQDRFETFDELYLYCYRVAATVGLMTLPIMGTARPGREALREAVEPAVALGIGLQLTNILRDVGEDRLRGRIYLPLEDLRRFNYTEQELLNGVNDSRYRALLRFQIARARRYFMKAEQGVSLLAPDSRLPVQASLDMYSQILDVLEENGYDNFRRRAYVSKTRKMLTVPLSYLRTRESPSWGPALQVTEWLLASKRLGLYQ